MNSFTIHKSQKAVYVKDKAGQGLCIPTGSGGGAQEGSMKGVRRNGQGRRQEASGSRDTHFTGNPFGTWPKIQAGEENPLTSLPCVGSETASSLGGVCFTH